MSKKDLPASAPEMYTRIARPWLDLGYTVIPTRDRSVKTPGIAWWPYCGDGTPPQTRVQAGEVTTWPGRRWFRRAPLD